MSEFADLLDSFVKEVSSQDPLKEFYNDRGSCETNIYSSFDSLEVNKLIRNSDEPQQISLPTDWLEKDIMRMLFFLPISRKNLKQLFDAHNQETEAAYNFILNNIRNKITTISASRLPNGLKLQMWKGNDIHDPVFHTVELPHKIENFDDLIDGFSGDKKYDLKYHDPFLKFFFFVHGKLLQEAVASLEKEVSKLREEDQSKALIQKMPVNMFNVMLTDKTATLEKLEGKIQEIEKAITETPDAKRRSRLELQKKEANKILSKAKINFPEDFFFSVYQHYAIFGGMKLLSDNNFKPTEFTANGVLEALNFSKINKCEITEIRKAFSELTVKRFPCYYVRQDKKDSNVWHFSEMDSPIFHDLRRREGRSERRPCRRCHHKKEIISMPLEPCARRRHSAFFHSH